MTIKLVRDKADCTRQIGGIDLVAAPHLHPPFPCQAMVEEQDTWLLLARQTTLKDPGKPAWYLANTLEAQQACQPGSIVVKGHAPIRLLAVVHNIDEQPSCRPESISLAYKNLWKTIQQQAIASVGLPLLGTVHGKLALAEAMQLFGESLQTQLPACLQRIWLILPPGTGCKCLAQLAVTTE